MPTYELINPSDCVTFDAPDNLTAALCTLLMGGAYGCRDSDGKSVPGCLYLHLLAPTADWIVSDFAAHYGPGILDLDDEGLVNVPAAARARAEQVVPALRSFAVVSLGDRAALKAALNGESTTMRQHAEALHRWNEVKRTSMNNICARANAIAAALEDDHGE